MSRKLTLLPLLLILGCGRDGSVREPWGVPITGGTMIVTRDGTHAVIADPDRDRVMSVDLGSGKVVHDVPVTAGDEPGRLVEDADGRIHVALRRAGSILTFAGPMSMALLDSRFACPAPRGLAFDAAAGAIHVACAGGELVTFPAAGGPASRAVRLERDLRDVVVSGGNLIVTKFRTAELLTIDATGAIVARALPPTVQRIGFGPIGPRSDTSPPGEPGVHDATASVAWRTIALPDGRIVISHQRHVQRELDSEQPGGYGGGCGKGPVEDAITVVTPGGPPVAASMIANSSLPVDLAVSPDGSLVAVVSAGSRNVVVAPASALALPDKDECKPPLPDDKGDTDGDGVPDEDPDGLGRPTSIAFTPAGQLVTFYPERPALVLGRGVDMTVVHLPGDQARDLGRDIFHRQTRLGIACASCHPEGHEDGQVWKFAFGLRRTQDLGGNLLDRAPFHWSGDEATLDVLMDDVFSTRMGGRVLTDFERAMLGPWLDRIPAAPGVVVDDAAVERGRELFASSALGCATCHTGELMTNNKLFDVGTGGAFKVPSLVGVGARAPFMHTGCAPTLADRFTTCGGGDAHGQTSQLAPAQLGDLIAYLESL